MSIKQAVGVFLSRVIKNVVSKINAKRHLTGDTIVIHPDSWRLFNPEQYNKSNLQYIVIKESLCAIKRSDYKHIIAYRGRIESNQLMYMGEKLRWLQLASHGANGFDKLNLYKNQNVIVSCVKDVFSKPIAQYCICAYFLFNTYSFRPKNNKTNKAQIIPDSINVMIYGLGNIGAELAIRLDRFGWNVYGVKRTVSLTPIKGVKEIYTPVDAKKHLRRMNYVVNLLPETPATIGMYNAAFFKLMNPNAIFCNVGRKSAVVDNDIAMAVKSGLIRGAVLDAHNEYNYGTPDIILTGYTSSISSENDEMFNHYYSMQLNAFLNHQEIKNKLSLK